MLAWKLALAVALPAAAALLVIIFFIYCLWKAKGKHHACNNLKPPSRFYGGVACLGYQEPLDLALRHGSGVAKVWRTTYPVKPFNWTEHPALVAEAVEHGWAAFGFTHTHSSCSMSSNLWDMCMGCSHNTENEPEINWEMGAASDFMQKVRLNPRWRVKRDNSITMQAVQTALPLPGPPLSPWPFPQRGYYEITVCAEKHDCDMDFSQNSVNENEHVKLISKHLSSEKHLSPSRARNYTDEVFDDNKLHLIAAKTARDVIIHRNPANPSSNFELICGEEIELQTRHSRDQLQILAMGLASGRAPPFRLPGCDIGSVGFHSDGRVYLNGRLHIEPEPKSPTIRIRWGCVETIVGCGFDPATKQIFFTLNGEMAYELTTRSAEFGCPLYPTIASNYDVTVLPNFGQSPFKYSAANALRIPDPCFKRPLSRFTKNDSMNDDSGDLFSMGRIDAQSFGELESPDSYDVQHRHALSEAESDLFEIVLDGRS